MCILLFIILVHSFFKLNFKYEYNRIFSLSGIILLFILILEILSIICNKTSVINNVFVHKTINFIGFSLTPLLLMLMLLFIIYWINQETQINIKQTIIICLPCLILIILSLLSYKFGLIFNIDNTSSYSRGMLFILCPLICLFYVVLNIFFLFSNYKNMSNEELLIFSFIDFVPYLIGLLQIRFFSFLTIWNTSTIAYITLYIFILNNQSRKDILTGLGNRSEYEYHIAKLKNKKKLKLSVMNIDLDGLKYINDTFGHAEGDAAISIFASFLKKTFSRKVLCIRYGGDEFIIFIKDNDKNNINRYIKNIDTLLKAYNESNAKPYNIRFSYGIGIFDEKNESIDELMQRCDQSMYEHKKSNHNTINNL